MTAAAPPSDTTRCSWAGTETAMCDYHDTVWGMPQRDNSTLFEFLTLEGAQAGLSWRTILLRRDGYREVFDGFDVEIIAGYTDADVARCIGDSRIIRNRAKVESTIGNAQAWLELDDPVEYVWSFVDGAPLDYHRDDTNPVPAANEISDRMSKQMKKRGFRFVGTTICYSLMQACGLVNDHHVRCFCHERCNLVA